MSESCLHYRGGLPAGRIKGPPYQRLVIPGTSTEAWERIDHTKAGGRKVSDLRRLNSTLAKAQFAGRRVDFASGLGWLRDLGESGAVARGAFDFRRRIF